MPVVSQGDLQTSPAVFVVTKTSFFSHWKVGLPISMSLNFSVVFAEIVFANIYSGNSDDISLCARTGDCVHKQALQLPD